MPNEFCIALERCYDLDEHDLRPTKPQFRPLIRIVLFHPIHYQCLQDQMK